MRDNKDDQEVAIEALARALDSLEKQSDGVGQRLLAAKKRRKIFIDSEVGRLLPSISNSVLKTLLREVPRYVDDPVKKAFANKWKAFWFFYKPGYAQTLLFLRTRLASFLDTAEIGQLIALSNEVTELAAELAQLQKSLAETSAMLSRMEQISKNKIAVPEEMRLHIQQIAGNARQFASGKVRPGAVPQRIYGDDSANDDDSDLWIYFLTDIPTSFRTWVLSAVTEDRHQSDYEVLRGKGGGFDGGGASGDFADRASSSFSSTRDDTSSATTAAYINTFSGGPHGASEPVSATSAMKRDDDDIGVGLPVIATDDSLGAFS